MSEETTVLGEVEREHQAKECRRLEVLLRRQEDPLRPHNSSSSPKLTVREVLRVYPPDERGLAEVLYRDSDGLPLTAFMRGDVLAYLVEGW